MKKIKLIFALTLFTSLCISQLKVDQFGRIGMGTNFPNSGYKCHIKGNLLLTNFPSTPFIELQFKVTNSGPEIGSTNDYIDFWSTWTGHNNISVETVFTISDSNLKTNIKPLSHGLNKLMKIKSFKYDLRPKYDSSENLVSKKRTNYGFISQQIEKEFNGIDITHTSHGIKLMDYNQILPVVVTATQEQQEIIESLQEKIDELKSELEELKEKTESSSTNGTNSSGGLVGNILYQNNPNPFNESTTIKYKVDKENFKTGSILIFDMSGILLKTLPVNPQSNEVRIDGSELKSGMYIYSLVVNNKEIDTKRMILSK